MTANHPGVVYGRRVAIVDGLRTPFVKSGTDFKDLSALDLASGVVGELLQRSGVAGDQIDQVVYGAVIPDVGAPNIAREIVLAGDMPDSVDAFSVSRACATSTQAVVSGAQSILLGDADIVVAGGAESMSKPPILYSDRFRRHPHGRQRCKGHRQQDQGLLRTPPKGSRATPACNRRTFHRTHDGWFCRDHGEGERHQRAKRRMSTRCAPIRRQSRPGRTACSMMR